MSKKNNGFIEIKTCRGKAVINLDNVTTITQGDDNKTVISFNGDSDDCIIATESYESVLDRIDWKNIFKVNRILRCKSK